MREPCELEVKHHANYWPGQNQQGLTSPKGRKPNNNHDNWHNWSDQRQTTDAIYTDEGKKTLPEKVLV